MDKVLYVQFSKSYCLLKFVFFHLLFLFEPGDKVMVIPSLSDEEAKKLFPGGVSTKELPSGKKYLRYTSHPK